MIFLLHYDICIWILLMGYHVIYIDMPNNKHIRRDVYVCTFSNVALIQAYCLIYIIPPFL